MKYIKLFNTHNDYETYINSQDKILPNVSYCESEDELHYNVLNWVEEYFTTVALEDGTISFNIHSSVDLDCIASIDYSIDNGNTWVTTLNEDDKEENLVIDVNVNTGDKILWRGDAQALSKDDTNTSFFSSTCKFIVKGNIMSLLYGYETFSNKTTIYEPYAFAYLFNDQNGESQCKVVNAKNLILPALNFEEGCYKGMFNNCTLLTTAPNLPAMTLISSCYRNMFSGCTSLTTTPELPATTLANYCYYNMFEGCTSLITAPTLPATTLANYCYYNMFKDCILLTTAPNLPATTLKDSCYFAMFQGCTSLTTTPNLPATTLKSSCYYCMFKDCTSLTIAPNILPATTLENYCYTSMFNGCTSLTTAPELPATTLKTACYGSMFSGCTSLNYIKAMFTTTPSNSYTNNWVTNVAANGTFVKSDSADWNVIGDNGVPSGWTIQTSLVS